MCVRASGRMSSFDACDCGNGGGLVSCATRVGFAGAFGGGCSVGEGTACGCVCSCAVGLVVGVVKEFFPAAFACQSGLVCRSSPTVGGGGEHCSEAASTCGEYYSVGDLERAGAVSAGGNGQGECVKCRRCELLHASVAAGKRACGRGFVACGESWESSPVVDGCGGGSSAPRGLREAGGVASSVCAAVAAAEAPVGGKVVSGARGVSSEGSRVVGVATGKIGISFEVDGDAGGTISESGRSSVRCEDGSHAFGCGDGDVGAGCSRSGAPSSDVSSVAVGETGDVYPDVVKGKNYKKNKRRRENARVARGGTSGQVRLRAAVQSGKLEAMRGNWRSSKVAGASVRVDVEPEVVRGVAGEVKKSGSICGSGGSVCTADTRTGAEVAMAQTLVARRVAENEKAEAEAKVAKKLAEHRLAALRDKDRTVAVQRLAAARYEQRINEAKAKSQASYKKCDESMKSLGSTGSAGEFALKQAVKEARDNAITLKYVQEQAEFLLQHVTPEIRQRVAEMPEPEYEDEFEVFGDCPSDYDEEQREAYYDDLNRRNADRGLVGSSPAPPRRELTPEEFLKIEEEIRALSANQV